MSAIECVTISPRNFIQTLIHPGMQTWNSAFSFTGEFSPYHRMALSGFGIITPVATQKSSDLQTKISQPWRMTIQNMRTSGRLNSLTQTIGLWMNMPESTLAIDSKCKCSWLHLLHIIIWLVCCMCFHVCVTLPLRTIFWVAIHALASITLSCF